MLNGRKRWIGNGTWADVQVVWARSSETKEVGSTGSTSSGSCQIHSAAKIENQIASVIVI